VTNQKTYHFAQDMSWVVHGNERKKVYFIDERGAQCWTDSFSFYFVCLLLFDLEWRF